MAQDPTEQFHEQTRELLRAQQETYVAAVKTWREAVAAAGDGVQPPPWPQPPGMEALPTAGEVAEAYYSFAAKLLADQSRFLQALSQAMTPPTKKP